jgi:hypothetical protein
LKKQYDPNQRLGLPPQIFYLSPAGKHDDQVDALGLIGQLLDQMVPGQNPKPPLKPKVDSGYRPLNLREGPLDVRDAFHFVSLNDVL